MMDKHRKTRKQKIIADYHRNIYALENKNISIPSPTAITTAINTNIYSCATHDILKTGILTLSIIVVELILFFLLKNHIIILPSINY